MNLTYIQGPYKVKVIESSTSVFKDDLIAVFHGPGRADNAALFLAALKRKGELESVEQGEAKGGG